MNQRTNKRRQLLVSGITLFAAIATWSNGCGKTSSGGRQEIMFAMWGGVVEETQMRGWIDRFEKENPDLSVKLINPASQYTEKVLALCASGTPPDVMMVGTAGFGFTYSYAQKGLLRSLDDSIDQTVRDDMEPSSWGGLSWKGKTYAFPREVNGYILYYNRNLFDAAGIAYPDESWTWEKLVDCAASLTKTEQGRITQYGLWAFPWKEAALSYGSRFMDEQGRFVAGQQSDTGIRKALSLMMKAREKKAIPDSMNEETAFGDRFSTILSGRVAMWLDGPWACKEIGSLNPKFKWDMTLIPMGDRRASLLYTVGYGIHAKTKNPEAAERLMRFLVSPAILGEFSSTGRAFPSSKSAYAKGYLSDPSFKDVGHKDTPKRMLEFGEDFLQTPFHAEVTYVMNRNVESIFLQQTDMESGLARMIKECNEVLARSE